jgi:PPP family 3-phenylpropionic acid transporter
MKSTAAGALRVRLALGAAYLTNFGALAASSPFLAVHLGAVGFSPAATAQVLALLSLARVFAVPAWTLLADRAGDMGGVLRIATAGSLVAFAALLLDPGPALVVGALALFGIFRAPFGALLDALLLREATASFGSVRAWGTAGYALGALATGELVALYGSRALLYVTIALLAAALGAAGLLRRKSDAHAGQTSDGSSHRGDPRELLSLAASLVRRPRVVLLFAVAALQEMGLGPYDALFPAYLTRLASARSAGFAVTLGAGAEFLFLLGGASLARRFGPERLLVVACAASAVRWAAIAVVTNPVALVAIQVLHAPSFGAFYMASVLIMDRETPPSLRASGQGIFGSFSFGIAAALGLSLAGIIERRGGMPAVFLFASGSSVLAAVGASVLRARPAAQAPG